MEGRVMNDELGKIWKEKVVTCHRVLSRYLAERTVENHEKLPSVFRPRFELETS
jgi:hypothetical protein